MNDEEYNVVKENLKNVEFNNLEEDMNIIKGKEPSFKPDDNQNNKNNNKLLIVCFIVIGILLGAVISTGAFYVYTKTANTCNCGMNNAPSNGVEPPQMPGSQDQTIPDMPTNDNSVDAKNND